MAQYTKPTQRPAIKYAATPPTPAVETPPPPQVTMRRYIHPAPCTEQGFCSSGPLLRAVEQQNLLLTELLSAVNGLTALLCSRSEL